nr:hypothetical protein CFP56_18883 [Quercus suber]
MLILVLASTVDLVKSQFESMKLSKEIIETSFISLLSIGFLVQSSLWKCSVYDLLRVLAWCVYIQLK